MKNYHRDQSRKLPGIQKSEYPFWGIVAAMGLIYLSPFTSPLLSYLALVICLYRVVRYDEQVFAADWCLLLPLTFIFVTGGRFSLLVWVCLFAGIWSVIRNGLRGDAVLVLLLLLVNYLVMRMQLDVKRFVLSVGSILAMYMVLPRQDSGSTARAAKCFCFSQIFSSVYALVFRNTWQIRLLRGREDEAIWGSGIKRFMGLMSDPNYYMAAVIVALGLLIKLKESKRISTVQFWTMGSLLLMFGLLSYSKTFLLVFMLIAVAYIFWQFSSGKIIRGTLLTVGAVVGAAVLLTAQWSPVAVILERLLGQKDINSITTGRWDVYLEYLEAITENVGVFLLGRGMAAERLIHEPHNLYLEILYHFGLTGFVLFGGFFVVLARSLIRMDGARRQGFLSKYLIPGALLALFMTLNGIFQAYVYGDFFAALLSVRQMTDAQAPDQENPGPLSA